MAKKKPTLMIPFNEQGMRTFSDVRSAISYFTKNGNFPKRRIVALFQSTFQIVSGKHSVNVVALQRMNSESLDAFFIKTFQVKNAIKFERNMQNLHQEMDKWKNKFKVSDIKQEEVK
jgi:hypothetical protein